MNTQVYIKRSETDPWPKDNFFYLVSKEGLFRCRNHEFFQSCTKADHGPGDLASQKEFLRSSYPKIPQIMLERVVGFFHKVADKQNSEAAVILAWNRQTEEVELIIPDQLAINSSPWGNKKHGCPIDVKYEIPVLLPHQSLIGDIHCHVDGAAYASFTDEKDETHRPGVHLVVGRIEKEPPEFHCEVVADGTRFQSSLENVAEGYQERNLNDVPKDWLDKVKLQKKEPYSSSYYSGSELGYGGNCSYNPNRVASVDDKRIIQKILAGLAKLDHCPPMTEVRQSLFRGTKEATYLYCEKRAEKFVKAWPKIKEANAKQAA